MSYSFGKRPPRSLESFGVAGVLGDECRVFYSSLFSTRHLGRVSDLLSIRLRQAGTDELRLRTVLLFTVFEAYRGQSANGMTLADPKEGTLAEPMVIECGIDSEKLAIGLSFTLAEKTVFDANGLAERLNQGQPKSELEKLLVSLLASADRLLVRTQPSIRRIEIVSLLALPGKMDVDAVVEGRSAEVVVIKNSGSDAPKAVEYVELGDLNYTELLKDDSPGASVPASSTGDILLKASKERDEDDSLMKALKSKTREKDGVTRISGTTENREDDKIVIKGVTENRQDDNSVIKISGGAPATPAAAGPSEAKLTLYEKRIEELQKKIEELQAKTGNATIVVKGSTPPEDEEDSDDEASDEDKAPIKEAKKLFKKLFAFGKGDDEDEESTESMDSENPAEAKPDKGGTTQSAEPDAPTEALKPNSTTQQGAANPETVANNLLVELQAGSLDRTLLKAQKEMAAIKKDLGSGKAKKWADGLMEELVAEKARLHDMAKKLNLSIRQKELEFKNKENALAEELRRRDDILRQKNTALTRTKDQLAQATMTVERLKQNTKGAAEDAHFKTKFNHVQKMLVSTKEENDKLTQRVDELKAQLAGAKMAANRNAATTPSSIDLNEQKAKYDRVQKQAEEYKKQISRLMDRLGESSKKERPNALLDEMKVKLDATTKAATVHKKEADLLKLRVVELEREEARLKTELARGKGGAGNGGKAA